MYTRWELVWSHGACATREIEVDCCEFLSRGFWLVDRTSTRKVENIDAWLTGQEKGARSAYSERMSAIATLRQRALEAAGAVDRLAALTRDEP
jgi:hypothetical protein